MKERKPVISQRQLLLYLAIFVVAPVLTYVIGKRLDLLMTLPAFPAFPFNLILGFAVFYVSLSVGIKSSKFLYREGLGLPWGEAKKQVQTRRLVVTGPYAYTRNPIILGYSLLPCGMGIMFQSLGMSTFIPLAVFLINIAIVKVWEEPDLEARFGEEYLDYKGSTPFLLPGPRNLVKLIVESCFRKLDGDGQRA